MVLTLTMPMQALASEQVVPGTAIEEDTDNEAVDEVSEEDDAELDEGIGNEECTDTAEDEEDGEDADIAVAAENGEGADIVVAAENGDDADQAGKTGSSDNTDNEEVKEDEGSISADEASMTEGEDSLEEEILGTEVVSENIAQIEEEYEVVCDSKLADASVTVDGLIYDLNSSKKTATLVNCEIRWERTKIYVPSSIEYKGVTYDVTEIGNGAFGSCYELTDLEFAPDSKLTSIGRSAFLYCYTMSGTLKIPASVESIGDKAFYDCKELDSIEFASNSKLTSIGECAFEDCSSLTGELKIPAGVTNIGNYAFCNCSGLSGELKIPAGVTSIGDAAFCGCDKLTGIEFAPNTKLTSIGRAAFGSCDNLSGTLKIPAGVKSMGPLAFSGCSNLIGIEFDRGSKLTSIEKGAFEDCSSLNGELKIPAGVTSIGDRAFSGCTNLKGTLKIPAGVKSIGSRAFEDCSSLNGELKIPAGVTSIGDKAFWGCTNLKGDLKLPAGVTNIGSFTFYNCSGLNGELKLPAGVTNIGGSAFYGCSSLSGVLKIPAGVTSIGESAFSGCSNLSGIEFAPGSKLTSIGMYAFHNCSSLSRVLKIPAGVTSIELSVFEGCSSLTGIEFAPDSKLTSIGKDAFYHCSGLSGVLKIPAGVTSIGESAFSGCSNLNGIEFAQGSKLTSIGERAFCGDSNLSGELIIPASVTNIGDKAFYVFYCEPKITKITNKTAQSIQLSSIIDGTWYTADGTALSELGAGQSAYHENSSFIIYEPIEDMVYTGSKLEPLPNVKLYTGGTGTPVEMLEKGVDYTLSYKNNTNAGTAEVTIKGKGNYKQNEVLTFTIKPKSIGNGRARSSDITATVNDMVYTGKERISKPVIKYGTLTLKEGRDYTLTYSGNLVNPGNVTVSVSGKGNYSGSFKTTYRIYDKTQDLSKCVIATIPAKEYTGSEIELSSADLVVYKDSKKQEIVSSSSYRVEYENNVNAGTATVTILPANNSKYGSSKKATFKITAKPINQAKVENPNTVTINVADGVTYDGSALKPAIEVIDNTSGMIISSDNYTYSFTNNTNAAGRDAAKAPTVNVTFKKNYSGKASARFDIAAKELKESDVVVTATNIRNANNKTLTEKDVKLTVKYGTKTLAKNKDYTIGFTYDESKEWQSVSINFTGNYTGNAKTSFKVYQVQGDIADENAFEITYDAADITYDGAKKTPAVTVKEKDGHVLVQGTDYTVSYTNNTNAAAYYTSKAPTIRITGKGAYKGTVTETFTIKPYVMTKESVTVTVSDMKYTGKALKPKVTVTDNRTGKVLRQGTDFDVRYCNNTEISDYYPFIVIKGKGNYVDDDGLSYKFRIYEKDISTVFVDNIAAYEYTGHAIVPTDVKVYADKTKKQNLYEGNAYTISYGENIKAGVGTVTITGMGKYGGSKTIKFVILPRWL